MQETHIRFPGQEDLLEKKMATHSSILAWRIPWTCSLPGSSVHGVARVGHNLATKPPPPTTNHTWGNSSQESHPKEEKDNYTMQWEFTSMRKWGGPEWQFQKLDCDPESQPSDTGELPMPHAKWETVHHYLDHNRLDEPMTCVSWKALFPLQIGTQAILTSLCNLTFRLTKREETIRSVWPFPIWCPDTGQSLLWSYFVGLPDMICLPSGRSLAR